LFGLDTGVDVEGFGVAGQQAGVVFADGACLRGREFENAFVPQAFALALEDADFIGSLLSLASGGQLHRESICHAL
jgi:hypothetical protein